MRVALLVVLGVVLPGSVEAARNAHSAGTGTVLTATWLIGGRFERTEWYEPRTGSTRQEDVGGPACVRKSVVSAGRMAWFGCTPRRVLALRQSTHPLLVWQTSDLLRPLRLLNLKQASIIGPVDVGGRSALRVRLPVNRRYGAGPFDAIHYADLDPESKLPVRFVLEWRGENLESPVHLRRVRRSSLPRDFFSPTKSR